MTIGSGPKILLNQNCGNYRSQSGESFGVCPDRQNQLPGKRLLLEQLGYAPVITTKC